MFNTSSIIFEQAKQKPPTILTILFEFCSTNFKIVFWISEIGSSCNKQPWTKPSTILKIFFGFCSTNSKIVSCKIVFWISGVSLFFDK